MHLFTTKEDNYMNLFITKTGYVHASIYNFKTLHDSGFFVYIFAIMLLSVTFRTRLLTRGTQMLQTRDCYRQ